MGSASGAGRLVDGGGEGMVAFACTKPSAIGSVPMHCAGLIPTYASHMVARIPAHSVPGFLPKKCIRKLLIKDLIERVVFCTVTTMHVCHLREAYNEPGPLCGNAQLN